MRKRSMCFAVIVAVLAIVFVKDRPAQAYVEIPYTLGRVINEATNICVMRVEKVDKERNLIIYTKVADLKGKHPADTIKHNIGRGGFHPREWQFIMATVEPGKLAVFFHNNSASETCIDNYWYQAYPGGEWWNMSHAEPYFLRSFAGKPEKLVQLVTDMLAGKEVIVPCMIDGDKNALQLRTAKIQRLKASLRIMDFDQKRDFAGWGGDEYRQLAGMNGFMMYGGLTRVDPGAIGMISADIDGDGTADLCLYGENKVVVLKSAGKSMEEVSIPYSGGARGAAFGDYNGDGKVDLLLATTSGPKLLTNTGGGFKDDTTALPREPYYNLTACAMADFDGDGTKDILLANGFLGLRLYRNNSGPQVVVQGPKLGKWYVAGPFDNAGGSGFEQAFGPEKEVNLKAEYPGRSGEKAVWKEANFVDGQPNNLALFRPEHNNWSAAYVYREIDVPTAMEMPISLGSDDTLTVWCNGEKLLAQNVLRPCTPDSEQLTLKLKPGKNKLLMKICNGDGEWAFYFAARIPTVAPAVTQAFEDVSERVGLGISGIGGKVKGDRLLVADVNGDGRPDFFYCAGNGVLAINTTTGFTEAKGCGLDFPCGKITPVFGDFNGDKAVDLFVPLPSGCRLYKNDGKGHFLDVTAQSGE
ncbi:MAG TPA: VCBS repeat-containing protein, partial [Tepidisphaeraceae bacterium]|nr:VCBS repeat-containing protein [Tepidisphaeraceae bacterium]